MREVVVTTGNMCKAPVKSSSTNQHSVFYRLDDLSVAQPTVSKHWRETHFKMFVKKRRKLLEYQSVESIT